jgi:hypothetical protein
MIIKLQRLVASKLSTIGQLVFEDVMASTLEDPMRLVKLRGDTCIPAGQYELKLRTEGGKSPIYQKRYPEMHHGMLWLQDVPNFEYVYIHIGNTPADTEGMGAGKDAITSSAAAYELIYPRIAKAIMDGDDVLIDIENPRE